MQEGVVVIDPDDFKAPPPPSPPPPANKENDIQTPPPPTPPANKQEEVFIVVEEMPEYPGGLYALGEYVTEMQKNLYNQTMYLAKVKLPSRFQKPAKLPT